MLSIASRVSNAACNGLSTITQMCGSTSKRLKRRRNGCVACFHLWIAGSWNAFFATCWTNLNFSHSFFFQAEDGIRDDLVRSSDVCSSDRSEEHTSELQS